MGKQSTRENKTIYQLCREAAGLTRAEASEKMDAVSDSKIEKFEYETQYRVDRVGIGRTAALPEDGNECHHGGKSPRGQENEGRERNPDAVILQPAFEQVPRHEHGDDERRADQPHEVAHQAREHLTARRAEDLADSDLLLLLLDVVSRHGHQTERRDQDRHEREDTDDVQDAPLIGIVVPVDSALYRQVFT